MSQQRVLNPPILSSAKAGWDGILVEKYCLPVSESSEIGSPHDSISIVLGRPFELDWRLDGGHLHRTTMKRGDVSITPRGKPTFGQWYENIECLFLTIHPALIKRAASESINTDNIELVAQRGVHAPQIYYIGLALLAELEAGCLAGSLYGESLSLALAAQVIQSYSTSKQPIYQPVDGLSPRKLQQAIAYINDNLAKKLTLSEIANSLGMSPYYFARLFKQSIGLAPHQYLIKCRIERAKMLLSENKLPIVEISDSVGCSSQSNFTALFQRYVGVTPKAYREQTKK